MPFRHKNLKKYNTIEDRDIDWRIRKTYIDMIVKYSSMIGQKSAFDVEITEDFINILKLRYNQLHPRSFLEL